MVYNFRIYAVYVNTKKNDLADSLSRLQFDRFWKIAGNTRSDEPMPLPEALLPASKLWKFEFTLVSETGKRALLKHDSQ